MNIFSQIYADLQYGGYGGCISCCWWSHEKYRVTGFLCSWVGVDILLAVNRPFSDVFALRTEQVLQARCQNANAQGLNHFISYQHTLLFVFFGGGEGNKNTQNYVFKTFRCPHSVAECNSVLAFVIIVVYISNKASGVIFITRVFA